MWCVIEKGREIEEMGRREQGGGGRETKSGVHRIFLHYRIKIRKGDLSSVFGIWMRNL